MPPRSLLDSILLELIEYLNISNIRPYLGQAHLLTDDEIERLTIPSNTTKDAVEMFVMFLKRKGPGHEQSFLSVLKESMKGDAHQGHAYIIGLLEQRLAPETSAIESSISEDMICLDCPQIRHNELTMQASNSMEIEANSTVMDHLDQQRALSKLDARAPLKYGELENIRGKNQRDVRALRCKVARDSQNITMKFASLVLGVYRVLVCLQVPVKEIRMVLLYFGCFKNTPRSDNVSLFSSSSDIAKVEDLASLIECLHNYSSWFNYRLIKFVAIEFGREEGKKLIADYEEELAKYFENLIAYECPEFSLTRGVPPGYEQLVVKVDWDYQSCKAQDVALFQASISSILGLEPEVFQLKSIEEGCVLFTWGIPSAIVHHLLVQALISKRALQEREVLFVWAAGKCVEIHPNSRSKPGGNQKQVDVAGQQPAAEHSGLASQYSTSYSSLSDLTASGNSSYTGDSCQSNRSSQNSTLLGVDILPTTEAEAEILSIYSGTSGDQNHSESPNLDKRNPAVQHSNFDLQHSTSGCDSQASGSHFNSQEGSHFSIHHFPSASSLFPLHTTSFPKKNKRALSVPHLNLISTPKSKVTSKARRILRMSPAKLLPKFLRPKKKGKQLKEHKEEETSSFPLLQLSEEPASRSDGKKPHYYVTSLPQQMPDFEIFPKSNVVPTSGEQVVHNSDSCTGLSECSVRQTLCDMQEPHSSTCLLAPGNTIAPLPTIQNLVVGETQVRAREQSICSYRAASPDLGSVGSSSGYCSQSDLNVHSLTFSSQGSVTEPTSNLPIRSHSLNSRSRYATQPSGTALFSLQSRSRSFH